jgi:hypothetical protein
MVQTNSPEGDIQNVRRRDFISRLAKTGAIAPTAVLLYNASSTPAAAGD